MTTSTRTLGTVKVGERLLTVIHVYLEPSGVAILARAHGPIREQGWVQLFDGNGAPVTDPTLPANSGVWADLDIGEEKTVTVTLHLKFTQMSGNSVLKVHG